MVDAPDALDHEARIAKAQEKFREAKIDRGVGKRQQLEKKGKKRAIRNLAGRTDRSELFPFRCRLDVRERCKQAAKESGVPIAKWMEEAIEAALEKHDMERGGQ